MSGGDLMKHSEMKATFPETWLRYDLVSWNEVGNAEASFKPSPSQGRKPRICLRTKCLFSPALPVVHRPDLIASLCLPSSLNVVDGLSATVRSDSDSPTDQALHDSDGTTKFLT